MGGELCDQSADQPHGDGHHVVGTKYEEALDDVAIVDGIEEHIGYRCEQRCHEHEGHIAARYLLHKS